jgi:hypothetical protein
MPMVCLWKTLNILVTLAYCRYYLITHVGKNI